MMPEFAQNYFVLVVLKNTKILNSKHLKCISYTRIK